VTDCYACQHNLQELSALPSRERVYDDGRWRVAHAFTSALLGWMVVVPRRHVVSMAQLTAGEATAVGPLLAGLSRGLERNLGARKAYVAFFAEAEGFAHLHVHVVPRLAALPDDRRGPRVFGYLEEPADQRVSPDEMDRLANQRRPFLVAEVQALTR
jgi:diadenosine tetraphosphate (Ap4A) HIT family hydrolase